MTTHNKNSGRQVKYKKDRDCVRITRLYYPTSRCREPGPTCEEVAEQMFQKYLRRTGGK